MSQWSQGRRRTNCQVCICDVSQNSKLGFTHSPLQHLPNMCWTQQESALWSVRLCACVHARVVSGVHVGLSRMCVCVFGMTWQPPALFKHGVGCAGSLVVRLGLPLVHAVPGTPWRGKEGAQQGQAASNTSPTEPKAPLVGLWTPEQAQGEMIMRTKTVLHRITHRDDITGF